MKKERLFWSALLALLYSSGASASCGAAFCTINTSWDVQGAWQEPGARVDLRYEYIRQDQPMTGSDKIDVGELPRHHDEVETTSQNLVASIDYTINQDWGIAATLPIIHRAHEHIHHHQGSPHVETWNFTRVGDVRVLARRRLATFEDAARPSIGTAGLNFGLKLPTGRTRVANDEGLLAERSLQPGTGTTDFLIGGYYSHALPLAGLSWFVQGLLQLPLGFHDGYRPGKQLTLDTGIRYALDERASVMLQANFLARSRDRGELAERDDSGGRALFVGPGVSYALTERLQAYAFLQVPLYQYVNGVQLGTRYAVALGVSSRF